MKLEKAQRSTKASMDPRVAKAIGIMRQSLADQLSVSALSQRVRLSPTRLRQLFKKETGQSPKQCLRELRMRHAQHLLSSTFLSVKEVAFLSGVNDVSNFVRHFRCRYSLTPTQFRTMYHQSPDIPAAACKDVD